MRLNVTPDGGQDDEIHAGISAEVEARLESSKAIWVESIILFKISFYFDCFPASHD